MDQQLLFSDLSQVLNMAPSEINLDTNLKEHSYWDSLAIISLIGAIDEYYKVNISGEELMQAVLIKDIFNMIDTKIQKSKV